MTFKVLQLVETSIFYEEQGSGLPVVLIHAGYLDSRMWDNQVKAFSKKYRVIRYDVRGFGRSSRSKAKYSDAADLLALLDHLKIRKAVLVGVSNGGRISFDFAVEHPDRVAAMIPVDFGIKGYRSSGPEENKLWKKVSEQEPEYLRLRKEGKFREAAAIDVDLWTSALSGKAREQILDIAQENVHTDDDDPDSFQISPEPPAFQRLGVLKMPILMIMGHRDVPGMIALNRRVHSLIPESELVIIEGADHIPSLSKPEEFNRTVIGLLDKIRAE